MTVTTTTKNSLAALVCSENIILSAPLRPKQGLFFRAERAVVWMRVPLYISYHRQDVESDKFG